MPPIEVGPSRAISAIEARMARQQGVNDGRPADVKRNAPAVMARAGIEAGEEPVDADRVAEIRKAVESGTYPVVPAKIADAMIAAGLILRSGK